MFVNDTDPAAIFGGTWVLIESRFLYGGSGINYMNSNGTLNTTYQGGETTHTLTVDEMPSHDHNQLQRTSDNSTNALTYKVSGGSYGGPQMGINYDWINNGDRMVYTGTRGGGQAHNNMPPYTTVNIWYRKA